MHLIHLTREIFFTNRIQTLAVGEPALPLAICVVFALRYALDSARRDAGITNDPWFDLSKLLY